MANDAYQDAVTKLMNYLNDTVVFAKAQLPDVANQMLVYGAEMAHFWMIFWICVGAFFGLLTVLTVIFGITNNDEMRGGGILGFITVVFFVFAALSYQTQIKIHDAPKLYIMDELAYKLKTTK